MSALILIRSGLKEEPFRNTKGRMKRDDANATVFGAVGNIFLNSTGYGLASVAERCNNTGTSGKSRASRSR